MTLTEKRWKSEINHPDEEMIPHSTWATMLSSTTVRCSARDITQASRAEGANITSVVPTQQGPYVFLATPVGDFPKIVNGLANIKKSDGTAKYQWAKDAEQVRGGVVVEINHFKKFEYFPDVRHRFTHRQIFPSPK